MAGHEQQPASTLSPVNARAMHASFHTLVPGGEALNLLFTTEGLQEAWSCLLELPKDRKTLVQRRSICTKLIPDLLPNAGDDHPGDGSTAFGLKHPRLSLCAYHNVNVKHPGRKRRLDRSL